MPWPNIHVVWKAQRCLVRINCWLHGSRFAAMKWYPNIQYHQHHRYHHDQSLKRLKMATALSESIVGVAINWRPPFHFSIHEMISPRGCLSYNPGNTAGCIRRYGHSYISIICTQVIPANTWGLHFKMTHQGPDLWLCAFTLALTPGWIFFGHRVEEGGAKAYSGPPWMYEASQRTRTKHSPFDT